jgi:hypothetical protein
MALTIVGRVLLDTVAPRAVCQDVRDFDRFYFLAPYGSGWAFYTIKWGDSSPTLIVDLGTILNNHRFYGAALDVNFDFLNGETDSTPHYVIAHGTQNLVGSPIKSDVSILEINVLDGTFTNLLTDKGPNPGLWQSLELAGFTSSIPTWNGTMFFMAVSGGGQQGAVTKMYGSSVTSGFKTGVGSMGGELSPVFDKAFPHEAWVAHKDTDDRSNCCYYASIGGNMLPGPLPYASQIHSQLGLNSFLYRSGFYFPGTPQRYKAWTDDYVYWFSYGSYSDGTALHAVPIYFRYNTATGAIAYEKLTAFTDYSAGEGVAVDAFDIVESNKKRAIYFGFGTNPTVYRSTAWPFGITSSVYIDVGTTGYLSLHTGKDGTLYAFEAKGYLNEYGNQFVKILDTEWEPDEPVGSLGGIGTMIVMKNKVLFFAGVPNYGRYIWWTQPMEPQSLDTGWDGFNSTVFDDEDNTALKVYNDTIYVGCKKGWKRLRGRTPDVWTFDPTQATIGPLTDKSACTTPYGIIFPRESGLWVFNEYHTTLFFDQGKNLMANVNWDAFDKAFALWDGRFYRLYYPTGTSEVNNRELVVDLVGGLENARGTEGDRAASAGFVDVTTGTVYLGDENGNLMTLAGGTGERTFELTTKEYPTNGLVDAGTFSKLQYDIDTDGATVTITPICDGLEYSPLTLPATVGRVRKSISLPKGNFYRVGFRIDTTTDKDVKIYEPWFLE